MEEKKPKLRKKTWGRFLRVIFGRTAFVIASLLIQLLVLLAAFQWLRECILCVWWIYFDQHDRGDLHYQ